jgi:hypothetical protein
VAGSFSAEFLNDIMETVQEATGAPVSGLAASTWHLFLTHTTLTDTYLITDTGRMAGNSTDFHTQFVNSTATWTLSGSTSPITFNNKVVITVTTGNFAAPAQTTIKGWFTASANSTTAGKIYAWGDVTPTQVVSTGNTVQFSTGDLTFTLGGGTAT